MKSVTELIEKNVFCWFWTLLPHYDAGGVLLLYVQTAIWYAFVIASIVIVEISTFIMQHQLTNFVMLASIVIVKSMLCVQYATKAQLN